MNEQSIIRVTPSIVSEPDFVGSNGVGRSPIKLLLATLVVSIAVCGIAMSLLASYMTPLGHLFWLVFHVLYIGGLVYYFAQKWKQYREAGL